MARLFIAIDLPQSCRDSASKLIDELNLNGLKRVSPELLHITLKFLGEVREKDIIAICKSLEEVKSSAIDIAVKGTGAFPNLKRPKVIWIGAQGDFSLLPNAIEKALAKLGFEREKREFSAHITVARVKQYQKLDLNKLQAILKRFEDFEFCRFNASSFALKQSTLTPAGPIYQTLREFKLEGKS
ncbi:MAG: RNA 2',3'-cyclic phosphodiesterase [Methanocellales archaeon]